MTERDIFIAALQKEDPADRQAYLDEACAGQPELRRQVENLLRLLEGAGSFLEGPATGSAATGAFQDATEPATAGAVPPGPGSAFELEPTRPATGGATTTGPGATISDPSAGVGTRTDPAATALFGEGANGADASVSLPGGTRVRYFGDYELIKEL